MRKWTKTLGGPALFAVSLAVTLAAAEFVLRWRYAEPARQASQEVAAIQEHLRLDPELGFTWKPSIDAEAGIRLTVRDAAFPPLSTDADGFKNTPDAIARLDANQTPDVIGLGDSFMEHAHGAFYHRFDTHGIFYANRAIHRQTVQQYNAILERVAAEWKPDVALYGLFENDFAEAEDYENWRRSGMDWFTYHSGTWCGPPIETGNLKRVAKRNLRGFAGLLDAVRNRMRDGAMTVSGPTDWQVALVAARLSEAVRIAEKHGIALVLVLIPSRATAVDGETLEAEAFDRALNAASVGSVSGVVDLRPLFQEHDDPASLYYVDDAHWNAHGMELAADAILDRVLPLIETESAPSNES